MKEEKEKEKEEEEKDKKEGEIEEEEEKVIEDEVGRQTDRQTKYMVWSLRTAASYCHSHSLDKG